MGGDGVSESERIFSGAGQTTSAVPMEVVTKQPFGAVDVFSGNPRDAGSDGKYDATSNISHHAEQSALSQRAEQARGTGMIDRTRKRDINSRDAEKSVGKNADEGCRQQRENGFDSIPRQDDNTIARRISSADSLDNQSSGGPERGRENFDEDYYTLIESPTIRRIDSFSASSSMNLEPRSSVGLVSDSDNNNDMMPEDREDDGSVSVVGGNDKYHHEGNDDNDKYHDGGDMDIDGIDALSLSSWGESHSSWTGSSCGPSYQTIPEAGDTMASDTVMFEAGERDAAVNDDEQEQPHLVSSETRNSGGYRNNENGTRVSEPGTSRQSPTSSSSSQKNNTLKRMTKPTTSTLMSKKGQRRGSHKNFARSDSGTLVDVQGGGKR